MMRSRCGLRSVLILAACLVGTLAGWGQTSTRLDGGRSADQIIGDTGAPYENLFRPARIGGDAVNPKVGAGRGMIALPMLQAPIYNLPLIERGFKPEEAEIKIGQFYVDFQEGSTSILLSDNVNQTETSRKAGIIGIARLTAAVMYQINDGLRLAVRGTFVWLPFQNKAGVAGFGINDPLTADFGAQPLAHAQLAYDFLLGGWDMTALDDFTANTAQYEAGLTLNQQFRGGTFDEADTAGKYSYRDTGTLARNDLSQTRANRLTSEDLVYRNLVELKASRMVPTVSRATLALDHENYWYQGQNAGAISRRDSITASLVNEKKDVRFKPFAYYTASNDDGRRGWDHETRAGLQGPVTENMDFLGDAGYYFRTGGDDHTAFLWRLRFQHRPGPLTMQSVEYGQTVTRPERDLNEYLTYRYYRILGPYLTGEVFGERDRFTDLNNGNNGSTEYRAGVRLTYDLGKRASLQGTVYYSRVENDDLTRGSFDDVVGRLEYIHHLGETVQAELTYQHENRNSLLAGDSFYENLFIVTLRKYF